MDKQNRSSHGNMSVDSFKASIRKGRRIVKRNYALALRRSVPLLEKVVPPLGRKMRKWGWIWQPSFSPEWLNTFYDDTVDPFGFDGTPYEAEKYDHTMRLLKGKQYVDALEVGAAEGVFTQQLAPICSSLLAIDVAKAAVVRARKRLANVSNVTFIQAALPHQMPDGKFDLIVASDVLYYLPKDVLLTTLSRFEEGLKPGGVIFTLDYLGDFGQAMAGSEVHELMKQHLSLDVIHDETKVGVGPGELGYTITIYKKPDAAS